MEKKVALTPFCNRRRKTITRKEADERDVLLETNT
jgi:hypothetical protein